MYAEIVQARFVLSQSVSGCGWPAWDDWLYLHIYLYIYTSIIDVKIFYILNAMKLLEFCMTNIKMQLGDRKKKKVYTINLIFVIPTWGRSWKDCTKIYNNNNNDNKKENVIFRLQAHVILFIYFFFKLSQF